MGDPDLHISPREQAFYRKASELCRMFLETAHYRGSHAEIVCAVAQDGALLALRRGGCRVYGLAQHRLVQITTDDSLAAAVRRQGEEPQPWHEGILTATLGNADSVPEIPSIQKVPLGPRQHLFLMGGIPWPSVRHEALEALVLRAVAHDDPSAAARLVFDGCRELVQADGREAHQLDRTGAVLVVRGS